MKTKKHIWKSIGDKILVSQTEGDRHPANEWKSQTAVQDWKRHNTGRILSARIIIIKGSLTKQVGGVRVEGRKGDGKGTEFFPVHLCKGPIRDNFAQYLQDLGPPAYRD